MGLSDPGGQPPPEPPPVQPVRPVVVGVDGSAASLAAATAAAGLAGRRGLPLRLVRALPEPTVAPPGVPAPRADRDAVRAAARAELEQLAGALGPPPAGVEVAVRDGPVELVLQHESRTAAFLVIGAHDPETAGPVAESVVRRAACPVLVDRPVAARGTIAVGVTGGPGTAALLAATAAEATRRGAALLVLHGWSRPSAEPELVDEAERALCRSYLEPLRAEFPDLRVDVRVERGAPEDYLARAAAGAELLVVGRRPHADRTGTAARVAATAPTPVLVVPLANASPSGDRRAVHRAGSQPPR